MTRLKQVAIEKQSEDPLPRIGHGMATRAAKAIDKKAGGLSFCSASRLLQPHAAMRSMVELLGKVEDSLQWPSQELQNLIYLQEKSDGGDRPIGLVSKGAFKLWTICRKPILLKWAALHQFWFDTIKKGN